LSSIFTELLMI